QELSSHRGRHTELVSVYVPQGYDLNKIINHLQQEQGTAENIKSAGTRKNVIAALEKMIQHLKLYTKTPENGLAAFSGNIAEREGQMDIGVWSIEPPVPLNIRIYRCDKEFVLEPLKEMLEAKEVYALVVMDRREGDIALLKGKRIVPLVSTHSHVPGKFKTGGQSAHRFEQNRELAAKDFYKRIAEYMKEQLLPMGNSLKGILVGGPGPTKHDFIEYIMTSLRNKIIAVKDLSYTGEFGLHELVEKSQDTLAKEEVAGEKKIMQKFLELLATAPGKVSYGKADVEKNLELGAVEMVLISEAVDDKISEELEKKAEETGAEFMIISVETREGIQLRDMGGIAAILRYEVH
ncbi:peptide chain release factor aRF-1, partial [Candidatus Woesearchaeota archaeon]|nr:peptide chain release factor aRF-1 [Candidatus Woesearchaeota archaeon]